VGDVGREGASAFSRAMFSPFPTNACYTCY